MKFQLSHANISENLCSHSAVKKATITLRLEITCFYAAFGDNQFDYYHVNCKHNLTKKD